MSEQETSDQGKMGAFFLGFVLGILVTIGAGGSFAVVLYQRSEVQAMRALQAEQEARMMAEQARLVADQERARAAKLAEDAAREKK